MWISCWQDTVYCLLFLIRPISNALIFRDFSSRTPKLSDSFSLALCFLLLHSLYKNTIMTKLRLRRPLLVVMSYLLVLLEVVCQSVRCQVSQKLSKLLEQYLESSRSNQRLIPNRKVLRIRLLVALNSETYILDTLQDNSSF